VILTAISHEIPLLILPTVLFPGTYLPMQAIEEPQRTLLRDCVREHWQVGVVLMHGDADGHRSAIPYTTGCLASVALVAHCNDNATDEELLGVVLYGERRVRVVEFVQQDPYLTGQVELLGEHAASITSHLFERVIALFKHYLELIQYFDTHDRAELPLPHDPTAASYFIASVLNLPLQLRQHWLESASTRERMEEQEAYLQAECDRHELLRNFSRACRSRYSFPDSRIFIELVGRN